MKKTYILFVALHLSLSCETQKSLLPLKSLTQTHKINLFEGCNALYTQDVEVILSQFRNLVDAKRLKDYEEFMIAIKLQGDIRLKLDIFEDRFTSGERVMLRTPLQKYSNCRTSLSTAYGFGFQTVGPSKSTLQPCDKTYAVLVQEILNRVWRSVSREKLALYKEFMILLKYHTDLAFASEEFEKKTPNMTVSRLRMPLHKYLTCRDSIIRLNMSPPGSFR